MTVQLKLFYQRDGDTMMSTGYIDSVENNLVTEEGRFKKLEYGAVLKELCRVMALWPDQEIQVVVHRTDRANLVPYPFDKATVALLRTDPVAAIRAMTTPLQSPLSVVKRAKEEGAVIAPAPLRAGLATLAHAFGDVLYFRVRVHELECPGCGFWRSYTTLGLLQHPEREGLEFKTAFVCTARCLSRFIVTCHTDWGYVATDYLLKQTQLPRFYFPREWNTTPPWVTREVLLDMQQKFKATKEKFDEQYE